MENLERKLYLIRLFNLYGELLSNAQKEFFSDYYLADLSLSEISENKNVSRSAVEDALKKASTKLEEYEAKLGVYKKSIQISDKIEVLMGKLDDEECLKLLTEIEKDCNYGI